MKQGKEELHIENHNLPDLQRAVRAETGEKSADRRMPALQARTRGATSFRDAKPYSASGETMGLRSAGNEKGHS